MHLLPHKRQQPSSRVKDPDHISSLVQPLAGASVHLPWRTLQHSLGNRAVQRLLAGEGARPALLPQHGPVVSDVQRDDDQPDTGTVTIQNVQYDYYDVTGNTLAQVAQQLDPTEWGRCSYHYDYSYESTGSRATKVDITLTLTIRLPRWQGRGWNRASQAAKAEWQRMLRALGTHEDDHADIARRWAPTFQQRLLNQRVGNLRQRFNRTLGQVRAEQRRFDRRTRHGQTQGVSLDTSIQ